MTRQDFYKYEDMLIKLQEKLRKDSGAQTVGELMLSPEGKAYKATVELINALYLTVPPWD